MLKLVPLAALMLLAGCLTPKMAGEAEAHKKLGIAYINEANPPGAITELRQAVKKNKWDKEAWQALGLAYFMRKMYPDAEEALTRALRLDPDFAQAQVNLGGLYLETQRWDDAIEVLRAAADNPEYREPARARHNLGWAYYNLGRYDEAREIYEGILANYPSFCGALKNLGTIDEAEGKLRDALRRYREANVCDSADLNTLYALGSLEARLDLVGDACGHLAVVVEVDPYGARKTDAEELMRGLDCESVSGL